jgi:hypothetical protein
MKTELLQMQFSELSGASVSVVTWLHGQFIFVFRLPEMPKIPIFVRFVFFCGH